MTCRAPVNFAAIAFLLTTAASAVRGQCTNQWQGLFGGPPDVDGKVYALAEWDPDGAGPATARLVVGGSFHFASNVTTRRIAVYDPLSSTFAALGAGIACDYVRDVAAHNAGGLAAIAATGQWSTATDTVLSWDGSNWIDLAAPNNYGLHRVIWTSTGDLIVAGDLISLPPFTQPLMRWDGTSWTDLGFGGAGGIEDIAELPNGNIVAVGDFSFAGGQTAHGIAVRIGSQWFPLSGGVPGLTFKRVLLLPNGDLLFGGERTMSYNGPTVYRWNGLLSAVVGGTNPGDILDMSLKPNGEVLVLTKAPTLQQSSLTWDGNTWTPNGVAPPSDMLNFRPLRAATLDGGDLFVAGYSPLPGSPQRLVRCDGTGWSLLTQAFVGTFAKVETAPSRKIYAISDAPTLGGVPNDGLSYWDGSVWHNIGWPTGGYVSDFVECANGDVVVIGSFTSIGGIAATNIARWDGVGWHSMAWSDPSLITDVAQLRGGLHDGDIVISGTFGVNTGAPAWRLARWDGTTWHGMGGLTGTGNTARSMVVMPNGDLIVGGYFDAAGGVSARNLAKWDGATWSQIGDGWQPSDPNWMWSYAVSSLQLRNDQLVVIGEQRYFGTTLAAVAEWTGSAWIPMPGAPISSLAVLPNADLVGGAWVENSSGAYEHRIHRWSGSTWSPIGTVRNGTAALETLPGGRLLAYGSFLGINATPALNIAELIAGCLPSTTQFGAGCTGAVGPIDFAATTQPWLGTTFQATGSGFAPTTAAVVVSSLQPVIPPTPLATWFPEALSGCDLLLAPDEIGTVLTTTGAVLISLSLPNAPSLAGVVVRQQLVGVEFTSGSSTFAISSSNGIEITLGTY